MTKLIMRKHTTIPTKKSQVFSMAVDGQTAIEVKIFQGERELVHDNKLLGNFNLVSIPPAPKGVPQIEIEFDIDADGIVNVSAKDKATSKDQSMTIASSSGLSDKEIERMIEESEKNAKADKSRKLVIEESNHAESVCNDTEKAMGEFKDQLEAGKCEKVTKLVQELLEVVSKGQGDEQGGVMLLQYLADHPATHHHLAEKLVRHFVSDDPSAADVAHIQAVLYKTHGDLAAATHALIDLPSAWQPLTKLRTPQEYVIGRHARRRRQPGPRASKLRA